MPFCGAFIAEASEARSFAPYLTVLDVSAKVAEAVGGVVVVVVTGVVVVVLAGAELAGVVVAGVVVTGVVDGGVVAPSKAQQLLAGVLSLQSSKHIQGVHD